MKQVFSILALYAVLDAAPLEPAREAVAGRWITTSEITHAMLENIQPRLAFRSGVTAEEFAAWQADVRAAVKRLFVRSEYLASDRAPCLLTVERRDDCRIEKWEAYPVRHAAVRFLVLIPPHREGVRLPAVLCIPGSGQTKEQLASPGGMADFYACQGYIAVAVDHPGIGETADPAVSEEYLARQLLEMGWSWLGYSVALDQAVLDWMKTRADLRADRIIISGFSLGTEPLMVLGNLNPDVYAFVYNDFLCRTLERACVLTKPGKDGRRPKINSIRHLVPGFWREFDFPDLVAALAPRPVLFTEGGMDRDFNLVRAAFSCIHAADRVEIHHYAAFQNPASRELLEHMPEHIDRDEFFRKANVEPSRHGFKRDLVRPWLKKWTDTHESDGNTLPGYSLTNG